jgi:hypothetical protein
VNACGPNGFFIRVETEEEDKSKQKRSIKGFFKAESDACIVVDDEEQPNSKKAKVDAAEDKKKAEAGESEPQSELKEKKRNASNDDSLRKFKDEWLGAEDNDRRKWCFYVKGEGMYCQWCKDAHVKEEWGAKACKTIRESAIDSHETSHRHIASIATLFQQSKLEPKAIAAKNDLPLLQGLIHKFRDVYWLVKEDVSVLLHLR